MKKIHRVSIIGAGSVGRTLGHFLALNGYNVTCVFNRSTEKASESVRMIGAGVPVTDSIEAAKGADLIFITVPDSYIASVCSELAGSGVLKRGSIMIHCSGSAPVDVLKPAREKGVFIGSMHPLRSFPRGLKSVAEIKGSYWGYDGDAELGEVIEELIIELGGVPLKIKQDKKVHYHIAATIACNYLFPLLYNAELLLQDAGADKPHAVKALLHLMRTTLDNIENNGLLNSLTGPIERGDSVSVKAHIDALSAENSDCLPFYKLLAVQNVMLALEKNSISPVKAKELIDIMNNARPL